MLKDKYMLFFVVVFLIVIAFSLDAIGDQMKVDHFETHTVVAGETWGDILSMYNGGFDFDEDLDNQLAQLNPQVKTLEPGVMRMAKLSTPQVIIIRSSHGTC